MAVKILHTSDWHLGAKLLGREMYDEYKAFFKRIHLLIGRDKVELLLISGDVFDDSRPSNAVLRFFEKEMSRLHDSFPNLQTVIIAGNHEDGEWLESMSDRWADWNIHVVGTFKRAENGRFEMGRHILSFKGCEVVAVPYPNQKSFVPTKEESREELFLNFLRALTERVKLTVVDKKPIVLMMHCYVRSTDQMRGKSKDTIGEEEVPDFYDYVAMGHAHSHHQVGKEKMIYYPGSPWPVSCNDNRRRSVVIVKLSEGKSPMKITVPPVENLRPMQLVPRRPAGMQTVLEKLKEIPTDKEQILVLNVRKPDLPEFNEQLFLSDVEQVLDGSPLIVGAVQWTDKKGSVSCKALLGKDSPSDEEERELLYPVLSGLDNLRKTLEGTVNQIEEIGRWQDSLIEESLREKDAFTKLSELSGEWNSICSYWASLKERIEHLGREERSPQFVWEESMLKIWRDDRVEERMAGTPPPVVDYTQTGEWKDILSKARVATDGYFFVKKKAEKLEEQKKKLQINLKCKEYVSQQKQLSEELKVVKAAFAKAVQERDMGLARIKLLEKAMGIELLAENRKGTQTGHLVKTINKLITRVEKLKNKDVIALSADEAREKAFGDFLEKLPAGRPPIWEGRLSKDISFIRLTAERHASLLKEKRIYQEEISRVESRMGELVALGVDSAAFNDTLQEKVGSIYERWIESGRQAYNYDMQIKRSIVNGKEKLSALTKGVKEVMERLASRD